MKLPVFKTICATLGFVTRNLAGCVRMVWLPLAVLAVLTFVVELRQAAILERSKALDTEHDAAAIAALDAESWLWTAAVILIGLGFCIIAYSGLLKWVIRKQEPAVFYLRVGAEEVRLAGAWLLTILVVISPLAVLFGIAGAGAYYSGYYGAEESVLLGGAATLGAVCMSAALWLGARFSLISPVAIARRSIGLRGAWALSKGNSGRLLLVWLVLGLPPFVAYVALDPELGSLLREVTAHGLAGFTDYSETDAMVHSVAGIAQIALLEFAYNVVYISLTGVAGAIAYRQLSGETQA